jgi:hypothetical protein
METAYGSWWFGFTITTNQPLVSRDGHIQTLGAGQGDVADSTYGMCVGSTLDAKPCAWNLKSGKQVVLGASGIARSISPTAVGGTLNGQGVIWTLPSLSTMTLPKPAAISSAVSSVTETSAGGAFDSGSGWQGLFWPTFASEATRLTPTQFTGSYVYGLDAKQQVGRVFTLNSGRTVNRPALWSGTAQSFVDLLPPGYATGIATKTLNGWQIGILNTADSKSVGAIWRGTSASFINPRDLVPSGYSLSDGYPVALTSIKGHTVAYGYYPDLALFVRWWLD